MRLRKGAMAAVVMSTAVFTALAPRPWPPPGHSRRHALVNQQDPHDHHPPCPLHSGRDSGTVTVLCTGGCYQ
ncbi:hypothetical protein [Streptomyces sp. NPDC006668]|uniref:hypothetical protein n=1 Tax=Streptomyces sp. NPDC006668 TaxID=3156903 RepID=UPI0033C18FB6